MPQFIIFFYRIGYGKFCDEKVLAKLIAKQEGPFEKVQANIYKIKLILFVNIKIRNIFYINKVTFYKILFVTENAAMRCFTPVAWRTDVQMEPGKD